MPVSQFVILKAFKVPLIHFDQPVFDVNGTPVVLSYDPGGLIRPFQGAGMNGVNGFIPEGQGEPLRLFYPDIIQFDVAYPLDLFLLVPEGFTVPDKDQSHDVCIHPLRKAEFRSASFTVLRHKIYLIGADFLALQQKRRFGRLCGTDIASYL